ncbi:MAG: hypothetical protein AB1390_12595, partial [Nitrospirota bacterium]
ICNISQIHNLLKLKCYVKHLIFVVLTTHALSGIIEKLSNNLLYEDKKDNPEKDGMVVCK